jgi:hypothetical protein
MRILVPLFFLPFCGAFRLHIIRSLDFTGKIEVLRGISVDILSSNSILVLDQRLVTIPENEELIDFELKYLSCTKWEFSINHQPVMRIQLGDNFRIKDSIIDVEERASYQRRRRSQQDYTVDYNQDDLIKEFLDDGETATSCGIADEDSFELV